MTSTEIEQTGGTALEPYDVGQLLNEAQDHLANSRSERTRTEYAKDFAKFERFCAANGEQSMPADPVTVLLFLTSEARTLKPSTVTRRAAAISVTHKEAGEPSPCQHDGVRELLKGIRRGAKSNEAMRTRKVAPARVGDIRRMVDTLNRHTTVGRRDAALLLVGFAGAMRRSELAGLMVDDLERRDEGYAINIKGSKTDQTGEGQTVAIPVGREPDTCPVAALAAWLDDIDNDGPVFRSINRHGHIADKALSGKGVSLIVKRCAAAAGLDQAVYSGHSLRAGFATTAAANGANERQIANQTRHKSVEVLRGYIRDGALFRDNAASMVDL